MTAHALALQRLYNQGLMRQAIQQPEEVVRWMGAIQAQDYGQAVWGIGARTTAATLAEVEQAIAGRKMLRTWPMRGTIHFVPPENARWMLRLSEARMLRSERRRQAQLGLDEAVLEQCKQLFYDALTGQRHLTRPAMLALLEQAGISTENQRGYHILYYAAMTGLICIGPMEGKQQTFVLLDEWAPNARYLSREEALAELARIYFTGHGPASVYDFAWWAGLTVSEARAGLLNARQHLIAESIAGKEYWQPASGPTPDKLPANSTHLLAGFDEYLLGYTDRSAALDTAHFNHVIPGGNGVFHPILVVDAQVMGTWKRVVKKNGVELTITAFSETAIREEDVQAAARRYSQFIGLPLTNLEVERAYVSEY